ncbi:MAG: hypothetical protein H0V29_05850 [Thermoleophilaceae bacterium]|nr:hypothetical protein [Thermoleophilaceae bacterium]
MDPLKAGATAFGGFRVAYGLGLFAVPEKTAKNWLGPDIERGPTQVGARALGFRDAIVSAGVVGAVATGAPVRPWLAACALGDLGDIAATLKVADELPQGAGWKTALVAGSFAAMGIALAAAFDP